MWNFIHDCLTQNQNIVFFDNDTSLNIDMLISFIKDRSEKLAHKLFPKMKCAILCKDELNAAKAVLLCWRLEMIPIPMSFNYGQEHYSNIINLIEPSIIFTDIEYDDLSIENISYFNLLTDEFLQVKRSPVTIERHLDDVAIIMCTSGTSGKPKGVMITESGLIKNIINIANYFEVQQNQVIMIARPLYHCAVFTGEFMFALYSGLKIYFSSQIYNPFKIINVLKNKNINVICGTPTLFRHLSAYINKRQVKFKINTIAISGECLTKETAKTIRNAFPETDIYNVYGLTEAAPRVSWLPPPMFDLYPESVGFPLKDTEIKISDFLYKNKDQSSPVRGEIFVKSPSIMKGYYKDTELTQRAMQNSWLATGDVGYIDDSGLLYICSRVDDMIIKAGMNIYPKEIENAIRRISIIQDVVAYSIKMNDGESIAVNVIVNKATDKKELMNLFSKVLPDYKMPSVIEIVTDFERTVSGKTIRPKYMKIGIR